VSLKGRTSASWLVGWNLREGSPRYGGRLPAAVARLYWSAHVCTRVHTGLPPASTVTRTGQRCRSPAS
jgi:hypothetical protein